MSVLGLLILILIVAIIVGLILYVSNNSFPANPPVRWAVGGIIIVLLLILLIWVFTGSGLVSSGPTLRLH